MSEKVLINVATMDAFADWIRGQKGSSAKMLPSEMLTALNTIVGLPSGIKKLTYGTFTPSSSTTSSHTIQHGLGEMPDMYIVFDATKWTTVTSSSPYAYIFLPVSASFTNNGANFAYNNIVAALYDNNGYGSASMTTCISNKPSSDYCTNTNIILNRPISNAGNTVTAKHKYKWICCKFA